MKINKKLLVITTIIILLPIIIGLIFWEQLPEEMATHWGTDNQPNGWNSKPMAVFGMPGIMAALHVFCLIVTYADPKKSNIGAKAIGIVISVDAPAAVIAADIGIIIPDVAPAVTPASPPAFNISLKYSSSVKRPAFQSL